MIKEFNALLSNNANYANPPIPNGYTHIMGKWFSGLTIRDKLGNFSVWIPAGAVLELIDTDISEEHLAVRFPNGSFYIFNFTSKEAYLKYIKTPKYESTLKYGGFYIGKFPITDECTSRPNKKVLTGFCYYELLSICMGLGYADTNAEMLYEAEHDLFLMWLILSGCMTEYEVCKDSSNFGIYLDIYDYNNFIGPDFNLDDPKRNVFKVSDICGNLWEVVQGTHSTNGSQYAVAVGGCWGDTGKIAPAASKKYLNLSFLHSRSSRSVCTRHSLLIK